MEETILQPKYMDTFVCIGGDCEMNCCDEEWVIELSHAYCTKLDALIAGDGEMKALVAEGIQKNRGKARARGYAKIKHNPSKGCVFHDEEGLCALQKKYGAEALSEICMGYPRTINKLHDHYERGIDCSCPEATRVVLLPSDPMEFTLNTVDHSVVRNKCKHDMSSARRGEQHASMVQQCRDWFIDVLQDRRYTIQERLVTLGLFCKNLDTQERSTLAELKGTLDVFKAEWDSDGPKTINLQMEPEQLADVQLKMISRCLALDAEDYLLTSKPYNQFALPLLAHMHILPAREAVSDEEVLKHYMQAKENFNKTYATRYQHIFENMLVNEVFLEILPLSEEKGMKAFGRLSLLYVLIRFYMFSAFSKQGELDEAMVVQIITMVYRFLWHGFDYVSKGTALLEAEGWLNLPYLTMFIAD